MVYSSLLAEDKNGETKKTPMFRIVAMILACCLAAWNTYLTLELGKYLSYPR